VFKNPQKKLQNISNDSSSKQGSLNCDLIRCSNQSEIPNYNESINTPHQAPPMMLLTVCSMPEYSPSVFSRIVTILTSRYNVS